jgi:hypothetical protein
MCFFLFFHDSERFLLPPLSNYLHDFKPLEKKKKHPGCAVYLLPSWMCSILYLSKRKEKSGQQIELLKGAFAMRTKKALERGWQEFAGLLIS